MLSPTFKLLNGLLDIPLCFELSKILHVPITPPHKITKSELIKHNIVLKNYLINAGDSLLLKRTILTQLERNNYPYIIDVNLDVDKSKCKHRLCSKVFYNRVREEYAALHNVETGPELATSSVGESIGDALCLMEAERDVWRMRAITAERQT